MAWLSVNLPIILTFIAGLALLVIEAFIPGFGIAGISGIVLEIVAVTLVFFSYGPVTAAAALFIAVAVTSLIVFCILRSAAKGRLNKSKLFLHDTEKTPDAPADVLAVGTAGTTQTDLRPSGIAVFNGKRVSVVTEGGFIPAGTTVTVLRCENGTHVVAAL